MEQRKEQLEILKKTLIYAKNNVPYYQELFTKINFNPEEMDSFDDIKKIPVLTKKDIFDIGEKIYSTEDIPYYTAYTGGSSGKALKCL